MLNFRKNGGLMDVIRCDEESYLVWKWHPTGKRHNNNKENAIRWGSSLRVKEGSVAVFVYKQDNGQMMDFIVGPFDQTIKTSNFPFLTNIIGLAYDGNSPFQAEIYFINLAELTNFNFSVPYFDVYDPRFLDFAVPVSVRGNLTFKITDYKEFIKLHRLENFGVNDFQRQVRDLINKHIKSVITNLPSKYNIPVIQLERKLLELEEATLPVIEKRLRELHGVTLKSLDISTIHIDKESDGYIQLKEITQDVTAPTIKAQRDADIKNIHDVQRIDIENMQETMRIRREEEQYEKRKQTQQQNITAFQIEKNAEVGIAGAEALGKMGSSGAIDMNDGGGMNPAAMMSSIAVGGVISQNISEALSGSNSQQKPTVFPPVPKTEYYIAIDGEAKGGYLMSDLKNMVLSGTLTKDSLVWKLGMPEWIKAGDSQELSEMFNSIPPIPPVL